MTLDEFLAALSTTTESFRWRVVEKSSSIRGTVDSMWHCPITAVCAHMIGTCFAVTQWRVAAEELGLAESLAEQIANAADFGITSTHRRIREKLYIALALK